jgi:protein-S-isoprenylcysteine O-methyltransferase Ste14
MTSAADRSAHQAVRLFDLLERGFLAMLTVWAFVRLWPSVAGDPRVLLILISEGLAMAFILLRRPATSIHINPYTALIAFIGTAAPLLVTAQGDSLIPISVGVAIMMTGLLLNIWAKISLNRSFGLAAANRGVKRAGPYRLLRHPMYAGYMTTQVAFLLLHPSTWNLVIYTAAWSMQLLRIQAEEKVLLDDPMYRAYADEVRFRLAPGLY